jgi:hypothetical protein
MVDCGVEEMKIESNHSQKDQAESLTEKPTLAVKIIRTDDEELIEIAYNEYKLLRSIDHKNIV